MQKAKLGVAATLTALTALPVGGAEATSAERAVPEARSYSDLLEPIPNAVERLKAADAQEIQEARIIKAQWGYGYGYYRPYYHHRRYYGYRRYWPPVYYGYPYYGGYPYGGGYYYPRYYHHHHHHHHHHGYWR